MFLKFNSSQLKILTKGLYLCGMVIGCAYVISYAHNNIITIKYNCK